MTIELTQTNSETVRNATPGIIFQRFLQSSAAPMADTTAIDTSAATAAPVRENGKPTPEELEVINRLAPDPVDPDSLYVFDAAPSTQRVDAFLTRMDISSLNNYAEDAFNGIPVMPLHKTGMSTPERRFPIGRSFWGAVEPDPGLPGQQRFVSSLYIRKGSTSNGEANTDDLIADIKAGIISDLSIGFDLPRGTPENNFADRGWYRCSICGQDMLAGLMGYGNREANTCDHYAGEFYNGKLCYADVMNARLLEYSLVAIGATQGAVILKAKQGAERGLLSRSQIRHLETVYNTKLLERTVVTQPKPVQKEVTQQKDLNTMANEQDQDNVRLEGQKEAIVLQVRTIMETRALDDGELAICKMAMDYAAKGDMENATGCIARLMNGSRDDAEPDGDESGIDYDQDGDGMVAVENPANDPAPVEPGSDASQQPTNTDDRDEDANGAVLRAAGKRDNSNIISLALTANERQQFKALETEVKSLRREVKQLRASASIGDRYREMLITETAKQAVRADMPEADTLDMLNHLPVEHIERLCVHYRNIGDARLGKVNEEGLPLLIGGRQTVATDPNRPDFERNASVKTDNLPVKSVDLKAFR